MVCQAKLGRANGMNCSSGTCQNGTSERQITVKGKVAPVATPRRGSLLYARTDDAKTSLKTVLNGLLALSALAAAAETRTVSNAAELQAALSDLNGDAANTVLVKSGTYDVSAFEMYSETMPAHLYLSKLTVKGESDNPRDTVIYGDRTKIVIKLDSGSLMNLTVSNGYNSASSGSYGAGISGLKTGNDTACSNLVLTCCSAPNTNGGGGGGLGVCHEVEACFNSANYGGGLAYVADARNCSIHDNTATTGGGGGLNLTMHGGAVFWNSANRHAGLTCNGNRSVTGCMVVSNTAATFGGGAGPLSTSVTYSFRDSTFAYNTAQTYGGGATAGVVMSNCLVACNRAGGNGGGANGCHLYDCIVSNNVSGANGGGMADGTATNCLIACNRSSNYGGGAGNATLSGCIVSNNLALTYGGGVYSCTAADSAIVHNMASNDYGAVERTARGMWALGAGVYGGTLTNCLVAGNGIPQCQASERLGGGGYSATFTDCRIFSNFANAGAAMNGGNAYGCVISNNATPSKLHIVRGTSMLRDCTFYRTIFDGPGQMLNCVVRDGGLGADIAPGENVCTSLVYSASTITLMSSTQGAGTHATNCLFVGNGVLGLVNGSNAVGKRISLVNCTFADNQLTRTFNGVGADGTELELRNCILSGNRSADGTAMRNCTPANAANDTNVTISHCLVEGGLPSGWTPNEATDVIAQTPRFSGAKDGANPYSIRYSSPARAAGQVMAWMSGATDIRNDAAYPRLRDGTVDIGCYQCWTDPVGMAISFQ